MDLQTARLKFLTAEYGGTNVTFDYTPFLPVDNGDGTYTPGPWLPAVSGNLKLCGNGYHYTRLPDMQDARLYLVEPDPDCLDGDTKSCSRSLRFLAPVPAWNEQVMRLWACDCVEHVLPAIEKIDADAARVARETIAVARRFAVGKATQAELDAAGAAARAAAGAAARDTEQEWQLTRLAEYLNGDITPESEVA